VLEEHGVMSILQQSLRFIEVNPDSQQNLKRAVSAYFEGLKVEIEQWAS